jgi:hypothetical protein
MGEAVPRQERAAEPAADAPAMGVHQRLRSLRTPPLLAASTTARGCKMPRKPPPSFAEQDEIRRA